MFFDVHVHAYRPGCPPADGRTRFATLSDVLRRYDELGIERGCLLPLIGPEVYLPQSNEEILELCAQSGGRLIPACNIDPRGMTNDATAPLGLWLDHDRERGEISDMVFQKIARLNALRLLGLETTESRHA